MAKKRKVKSTGKKERKSSESSKKSTQYENGKFMGRTCPKCGPGVFMANHKERFHCGKCGFMEVKR